MMESAEPYDKKAEEFQHIIDAAPDPWEAFKEPEKPHSRRPDFKVYTEMQRHMATNHIGAMPNTTVDDMFAKFDAEGRGDIRNIQLPYPQLNRAVGNGLALRNITALVASPGASKTWWAINFLLHAMTQGFRVRYLGLEDCAEMWIQKFMAAKLCDWRIVAQPSTDDPDERQRVAEHKRQAMENNREFLESLYQCVAENPRIVPDRATGDVRTEVHYEDILAFVEDEAESTDIVVVDPVSMIDFSEDGLRDFAGQARFMQRLASIVARNPIHVILVVHTTKQQQNGGDMLSGVGGSSKFTQLAQNVLVLQRHEPPIEDEVYGAWTQIVEHKLTMTVAKSRAGLSLQKYAFDFVEDGPRFREYGLIKQKATKRKVGQ